MRIRAVNTGLVAKALFLIFGCFVASGLVGAVAAGATTGPTGLVVTVVHGIAVPAFDVADVRVDGSPVIDDLRYEDPPTSLAVAAGPHQVAITARDAAAGAAPLLTATIDVRGDVSVVAQVDAGGAPVLRTYPDDFGPTPIGTARVVVRHAAQAPAIAMTANGGTVVAGVANGGSVTVDLPAGTYSFAATADGQPVPGIVLRNLPLRAGNVYTVYATGDRRLGYAVLADVVAVGVARSAAGPPGPAAAGGSATTARPALPTAVPAGDGSTLSGGSGTAGAGPALMVAIALAMGLAIMRGGSSRQGQRLR